MVLWESLWLEYIVLILAMCDLFKLIEAEWCISINLPSLVQIMACNLVGAKPPSEQCRNIVNPTLWNKLPWKNINQNSYIFSQENAF